MKICKAVKGLPRCTFRDFRDAGLVGCNFGGICEHQETDVEYVDRVNAEITKAKTEKGEL